MSGGLNMSKPTYANFSRLNLIRRIKFLIQRNKDIERELVLRGRLIERLNGIISTSQNQIKKELHNELCDLLNVYKSRCTFPRDAKYDAKHATNQT